MPSSAGDAAHSCLPPLPTRRSSDLIWQRRRVRLAPARTAGAGAAREPGRSRPAQGDRAGARHPDREYRALCRRPARQQRLVVGRTRRSEEHTSELQSLRHLVCRLLPATPPTHASLLSLHDALPISFGSADAFVWHPHGRLAPVPRVSRVDLGLLKGIEQVRDILIENTERFADGLPANNALLWGARGDRKSTRLNSSHLGISYAVFCRRRRPLMPPSSPYTTLFRSHLAAPTRSSGTRTDGWRRCRA